MDYEQKYKNALKWARGIYLNAVGADREDLEHYFPEIKESEDESIRNDLKRAISVALDYSYLDKECANNCLAWLEKQGGAKERPTLSEEDETYLDHYSE